MKVALVHDWLTGMRGGEKVLEVFCELYPQADLYTLIYLPDRVSLVIRAMKVRASWINRLPGIEYYYRYCLPIFPRAIESLDLSGYDLILSSSHCVAKGVLPNGALHVAYVHAPMRYVWDMYDTYFGSDSSWLARTGMFFWRKYLQTWDLRSSERVDFFCANSENVADKIEKLYGRDATVVHPPVDVERFYVVGEQAPYYLLVSALVPYKKIDIAIGAFNKLKAPLKIVGDGPLREKLEAMAGPNIDFLGWVDDTQLARLYAECQALIFPGEEDFGIVPLEAQASGRPVIAYGKGGVLETVVPLNFGHTLPTVMPTGIYFHEVAAESLIEAVRRFRENIHRFEPVAIRQHASRFSRERFKTQMREYLDSRLKNRSNVN
jgi:glycosyltransferase involved in cell wall biosynthesis